MDPVSIISIVSGVVGIASAGTKLSIAIHRFVQSTRGAPREMSDMARTISDLSFVLEEFRRVVQDNAGVCNRRLLRRIDSTMRRISKTHKAIHTLMDSMKGVNIVLWSLKRSEMKYIFTRIETYRTGIDLMLRVVTLGAVMRKETQLPHSYAKLDEEGQKQEHESQIFLLRQQSENLAFVACQSLVDLSENHGPEASRQDNVYASQASEVSTQIQTWTSGPEADDTSEWLVDMAFPNYTQPRKGYNSTSSDDTSHKSGDLGVNRAAEDSAAIGQALVLRKPSELYLSELQMAICEPDAVTAFVNELLAENTNLTEEEIGRDPIKTPDREQQATKVSENSRQEKQHIYFKDSVGRKFTFPFYRAKTWQTMEDLIKQAFMQVDVLAPHVMEGHYDLIGPSGDIILPSVWEDLIEPEWRITMAMWPMDKMPPLGPKLSGISKLLAPSKTVEPQPRNSSAEESQSSPSALRPPRQQAPSSKVETQRQKSPGQEPQSRQGARESRTKGGKRSPTQNS